MFTSIRIILLALGILIIMYIIRKIRRSQLLVWDAAYWIFVSFIIFSMSLLPQVYSFLAELIGFKSVVTFVFMIYIFLLLLKLFLLNVRISNLEYRMRQLIEEIAIDNKKD